MSLDDLRALATDHIKFIEYSQLAKMTFDDLWAEGPRVIVLLNIINKNHREPVGHWITLLKFPDYVEHFDPYGLTIDQELAFTHDKPLLGSLLRGHTVVENRTRLQKFRENVNTCGRWAVVRANKYPMNLHDFKKWIHDIPCEPDVAITLLTTKPGGVSSI